MVGIDEQIEFIEMAIFEKMQKLIDMTSEMDEQKLNNDLRNLRAVRTSLVKMSGRPMMEMVKI